MSSLGPRPAGGEGWPKDKSERLAGQEPPTQSAGRGLRLGRRRLQVRVRRSHESCRVTATVDGQTVRGGTYASLSHVTVE